MLYFWAVLQQFYLLNGLNDGVYDLQFSEILLKSLVEPWKDTSTLCQVRIRVSFVYTV